MKHQNTYDIVNLNEADILRIIWSLSRTDNRIHACLIAYSNMDMNLAEADAFTQALRKMDEFNYQEACNLLP